MNYPDLIEYLEQFVTERRRKLFDEILSYRTRYFTVVLEDIYQSQNASAVLRTCDCSGIQDIHIIENRNDYDVNPDVTLGSDQWLSLIKYNQGVNNTVTAIQTLKSNGYRIVATTPHQNDTELRNFDIEKGKCAFMFGTELKGLSDKALELADEYVKIPMHGFTESYNISVSAAIILYTLTQKLRNSEKINWGLSDMEKNKILLSWLKVSVKDSDRIIKRFFDQKNN